MNSSLVVEDESSDDAIMMLLTDCDVTVVLHFMEFNHPYYYDYNL